MPPRSKPGRQTAISDFFKKTPPRPQKRRSEHRSPFKLDEPVTRRPSPSPPIDAMEVEPPSDPAQELTQEELDVHDQLESLGCSQKRPRGPPPDDTDGTPPRDEPSEAGDSDDSLLDMERDVALRRSTRIIREVVRFGNEVDPLRGTSIFGNGFSKTRTGASEMKRALREVNHKARQEERLDEMRKQMHEAGKLGQDETLFKEMADAEERAEEIRREAQDKYSAPIPLFCHKVVMRSMPKQQRRKRSGTYAAHPVHDLVVQAMKAGDDEADIALSFVVPVVQRYCRSRDVKGLARVADYLFQLAVFDPTNDTPGIISRDFLVEAIEDIIQADLKAFKSTSKRSRLQNVMSVLEHYGAVFDDNSDLRKVGDISAVDGSLDKQAPLSEDTDKDDKNDENEKDDENAKNTNHNKDDKDDSSPPVSEEFNRCERNLGRLFRIAALQVRRGVPLRLVISDEKLDLRESVLFSLGICTRVLLSAFGNRLYAHVGELIEASISLIDDDDWPNFRMKAAAYIHSFTTRLELHVELVTYLLPYTKPRSRSLALDIAYLSLQQWCGGNTPSMITTNTSTRAREVGIKTVSFCLTDVVRHMQAMPDITPNTDMIWVSLLARLLKVVLSEPSVLERRMAGELGALKKVLVKMRVSTRRLNLEVPVQRMRVALDAVERILQDFAHGSERNDIGMVDKKRQGSLMAMKVAVCDTENNRKAVHWDEH